VNRAVTTGLKGAAIAGLAGYVGTKVMEPVSQKLYELESEQARAQVGLAVAATTEAGWAVLGH
jgi:hypothetical protein